VQETPNVVGGDACIRNTRIAVWMLVEVRRLGWTDQRMLEAHPSLSQADLDMAWDYYRRYPEEIDQAIQENEQA
jgi:uncharacterized protein (DUF433 family)